MRQRDKSFIRSGHGNGAGAPRIETPPIDELSPGLPAAPGGTRKRAAPAVARTPDGRLADRHAAAELGRLGAAATNARRQQLRALEDLGLRGEPAGAMVPYLPDAQAFALSEVERLAREVGGGTCSSAACSMVQSAALQLAGSRCAFASGQLQLGSRLADASRQNLLAAHELCARDALARNRPGVRGLAHGGDADAVVALAVARATEQATASPEFDDEQDDQGEAVAE